MMTGRFMREMIICFSSLIAGAMPDILSRSLAALPAVVLITVGFVFAEEKGEGGGEQ